MQICSIVYNWALAMTTDTITSKAGDTYTHHHSCMYTHNTLYCIYVGPNILVGTSEQSLPTVEATPPLISDQQDCSEVRDKVK